MKSNSLESIVKFSILFVAGYVVLVSAVHSADITECSFSVIAQNRSGSRQFGFGWAMASKDSLRENLIEVHTDQGWAFHMGSFMKCEPITALWGSRSGVIPGEFVQFGLRFNGKVNRTITRKTAWLRPPTYKALEPDETIMPILLQDFDTSGFYIIDGWPYFKEPTDPVIVYPKWAISPEPVPLDSLVPGNSMLQGLEWTVEPSFIVSASSKDSILIPALCAGASAIVQAELAWAASPADIEATVVNQCIYLTAGISMECLTPTVARGDTIIYNTTIRNEALSSLVFDLRTDLKLPGGGWYPGNPLKLYDDLKIAGNSEVTVTDSIPVPLSLSAGTYALLSRIGYDETDDFFCADSFEVEITNP